MTVEQAPVLLHLPLAPVAFKFKELTERVVGLVPLCDYLHCQGKGLNTEATASIKRCTTPQDLFYYAFESLIGEIRPSEASRPLEKLSQWGPRVRQVVETWVRDDIEEVRQTKLRNLFEFFACENPRYLEEDPKLWKQSNGSQEMIDVDKIFARAFTPEQFAQMFLELETDHYYGLKKEFKEQIDPFKNVMRAFARRIPPSPPRVFAEKVREKLLLVREPKKYPLDKETKAHMASVAIYVDTNSRYRLDLETYLDGLFFNLAYACEGIWERLHDHKSAETRQATKQKVLDIVSKTNVGESERQFWRGLAEDVIGRLNDGYRTWEGIVQLDPADYITGLARKLDSRAAKDSVSSAFIFSGIDELLSRNHEKVLIPINQSVRLAKIALKEYDQPHGDEVRERLLLSVMNLLTQSNQHRRMAIMDQELNDLLKSAINLNTGEYGPVIKRKPTVAEESAIEVLNGLLFKPQ